MITLSLFTKEYRFADGVVHIAIDPDSVESVMHTQKRPADSGWQDVSVITMKSGIQHTVYGHVGDQIEQARTQIGKT